MHGPRGQSCPFGQRVRCSKGGEFNLLDQTARCACLKPGVALFYSKVLLSIMSDLLSSIISADPEVQGGAPVFRGTRVPVQSFFDHIEAGDSIDEFLLGFSTVKRDQVIALLEFCRRDALRAAA